MDQTVTKFAVGRMRGRACVRRVHVVTFPFVVATMLAAIGQHAGIEP